jgi:hypothetical protein
MSYSKTRSLNLWSKQKEQSLGIISYLLYWREVKVVSQKSDAKDLKRLQQELKKAQHDLKVSELQERTKSEIRRLEWEKEKYKLQLQHDKERWAAESKIREEREPDETIAQETFKMLRDYMLMVTDLKAKIGELNAQVAIYKPFFDKHTVEEKT